MKEGNYYQNTLFEQQKRKTTSGVMEDDAEKISKNKSRFDMQHFPKPSQKWDSAKPSTLPSISSILEDYMMEDEETKRVKADKDTSESKTGQWKAVKDEAVAIPSAPQWPAQTSQAQGAPETSAVASAAEQANYPSNYSQQPPSGFDQRSYYQQYQQYQQYAAAAGYQNYYGYPGYGQAWQQSSGVILPDLTQPPPVAAVPKPVPVPNVDKKYKSPDRNKSKRSKRDKKKDKSEEISERDEDFLNQRESYVKRAAKFQKELDVLRQTQEVVSKDKGADENILKENIKLQAAVQSKLRGIHNAIKVLDSILGNKVDKRKKKPKERRSSSSSSTTSDEPLPPAEEEVCNYVFFDPEEHWCQNCNLFPATAKEYLNHLHTAEHKQKKDPTDIPWHVNNLEKERTQIEGAPTKRVPIRGLQFFVACHGWYCKLCSAWIGDLHCASMHLKSQKHMDNFEAFLTQNVDWEETWVNERKQAMKNEYQSLKKSFEDEINIQAKSRDPWSDSPANARESFKITVANDDPRNDEDDATRSIRVQMRNKAKPLEAQIPMGPALPPEMTKKRSVDSPLPQSNGKNLWAKKQTSPFENDKLSFKSQKDRLKRKNDSDDDSYRRGSRKWRGRDRSYDRSRSRDRDRSRSRGRSRDRSVSRGRSYGRSRSRGRSIGKGRDYSRSRSREYRRRRRSSSSRRGRSRSRSSSRKPAKRTWVAPPSSPPPYIVRKAEEKDKWDKPKKKAVPNPAASLPKSKLPFIGRMPLLKHIAKKKQPEDGEQNNDDLPDATTPELKAPEDMEIDSGASEASEELTVPGEDPPGMEDFIPEIPIPEEEEVVPVHSSAPLHEDFQETLSILYPGDSGPVDESVIPKPVELKPEPARKITSQDMEELLMLGIDPEDMVAQGLST